MLLVVIVFLIVTEAIYEAFFNEAQREITPSRSKLYFTMSEIVELIYRGTVTAMAIAWVLDVPQIFVVKVIPYYEALIAYLLIRYGIFDQTYNISCGNPLWYIGGTKNFDKAGKWFFRITKFPPSHWLFWTKLILFAIGVSLIFNLA